VLSAGCEKSSTKAENDSDINQATDNEALPMTKKPLITM
jgi:hypothetical protein